MMLGSKGLLPPLIPDCSALRALTILKNIRNPLIFLRKMASYSCFWRVPRLKIFMQASLHQISNLLTLVSCHDVARPLAVLTLHSFEFAAVLSPWPYLQKQARNSFTQFRARFLPRPVNSQLLISRDTSASPLPQSNFPPVPESDFPSACAS